MPTQIIDGFRLNAATPIDSRMVTKGLAYRNNLQHKYEGLRVYDTEDKKAYVWIEGAWAEESSGGSGGAGTGTLNRVAKFTSAGTGDSVIVDTSANFSSPRIGIGKTPGFALDVEGVVSATSFRGILDADYILSGTLALQYIEGANAAKLYVMKSLFGNPTWIEDTGIISDVEVTNDTQKALTYIVTTPSAGPSSALYINSNSSSKAIAIDNSKSQLLASGHGTNQADAPGYSFIGNQTAGLYGGSSEIGLSFNSKKQVIIKDGLMIVNNNSGTPVLTSHPSGIVFGASASSTVFDPFVQSGGLGSATTPDYTWLNDRDTGIYRPAANEVGIAGNGAVIGRFTAACTTLANHINFLSGSGYVKYTQISAGPNLSSCNVGTMTLRTYDTDIMSMVRVQRNGFGGFISAISDKYIVLNLNGAAAGRVLTSQDTTGKAIWQALPDGIPYGTILMWFTSTAPTGWRLCDDQGYIYLSTPSGNGYAAVPDITNRMLFGANPDSGVNYNSGKYPSQGLCAKLTTANIPAHTHYIYANGDNSTTPALNTIGYVNAKFEGTAMKHHDHAIYGQANANSGGGALARGNGGGTSVVGDLDTASAGTPEGKVTLYGSTNYTSSPNEKEDYGSNIGNGNYNVDADGIQSVNVGKFQSVGLIFIVKWNPSATEGQEGHWVDTAPDGYTILT
jgi:hypothetical protein